MQLRIHDKENHTETTTQEPHNQIAKTQSGYGLVLWCCWNEKNRYTDNQRNRRTNQRSNNICTQSIVCNFYHDNSAARYYNAGRMGDMSLTIARVTRVLADVLVANGADAQLGAIIEDANSRRRNVHRRAVLVPQDLRRWGAICLAVEDDRVTCVRLIGWDVGFVGGMWERQTKSDYVTCE